jgi:ABC-type multidrug transport system fused ATPase/permease subunit
LSSLSNYDRIVVLERGRIVEDGAPHDLMRQPNGAFSQLYERQRSS